MSKKENIVRYNRFLMEQKVRDYLRPLSIIPVAVTENAIFFFDNIPDSAETALRDFYGIKKVTRSKVSDCVLEVTFKKGFLV